jgi:hypothetical protein
MSDSISTNNCQNTESRSRPIRESPACVFSITLVSMGIEKPRSSSTPFKDARRYPAIRATEVENQEARAFRVRRLALDRKIPQAIQADLDGLLHAPIPLEPLILRST